MEKRIKGLMDLNGAYITSKGMVVIKAEDNWSMEIVNTGSGVFVFDKTTTVTLNLGKPAITALLRELGIDVVFDDGYEETKPSIVKSETTKEKDLRSQALNKLYYNLNTCETSSEFNKILSLIERVEKL